MELPKTIKIGPHKVKVITIDKEDDSAGYWKCPENTIYINSRYPHSQQVTTFLHEILHCINYNLSEEQCEFIAQGLASVVLDNQINFKEKL